jgi:ABC-type glycerol-3-phosphate transport system substrate-binding protein
MLIETSTASTTIEAFLSGDDVDSGGVDVPAEEVSLEDLVPDAGPFPGIDEPGQVQIGGGAFYIPATNAPEVQAAAWDFSRFMASEEGQVIWHTQGSYLPIGVGAAESPAITEFWDSGLAGGMLRTASTQLFDVDPDRPGPIVGPTVDYGAAVEAALGKVAFQGASVDDAIAQAEEDLDAALQRYEEDNAG